MRLLGVLLLIISTGLFSNENKMDYWKEQRKGANGSFKVFREEWFKEAKEANIEYIRLNPLNFPSNDKHFLIGSASKFTTLNKVDLNYLKMVLDAANKYQIKIVLTMFELPGRVYFDIDKRDKDNRLWKDKKYWVQSFELWKQIAIEIKDHPAIVAFNPLNEPDVAANAGFDEPSSDFKKWLKKSKGTSADLNLFNKKMLSAIRSVDKHTPIMLDGYFYCSPKGFPFMNAYDDPNILYPFHNPAPWQFSTYRANKGRYSYPDAMPLNWNGPAVKWDLKELMKTIKPVIKFQKKNKITDYQIIGTEVWCDRRVEGCAQYFKDILKIYNDKGWHWAFYAFRNDTAWTGLDYELGTEPMKKGYWDKIDNVDPETLKVRKNNIIWTEIQKALKQ